jgi:hypothetical protein
MVGGNSKLAKALRRLPSILETRVEGPLARRRFVLAHVSGTGCQSRKRRLKRIFIWRSDHQTINVN